LSTGRPSSARIHVLSASGCTPSGQFRGVAQDLVLHAQALDLASLLAQLGL
jgi:hypothetical protein